MKVDDWVGRNSIIGIGGADFREAYNILNIFTVNYFILDKVYKTLAMTEDFYPQQRNKELLYIDPAEHAGKGRRWSLWSGEDVYSSYIEKERQVLAQLDQLIPRSSRVRDSYRSRTNLQKIMFWVTVLEKSPAWLTDADKTLARGIIMEYLPDELPLTLPFPNEDLMERSPDFYVKGSMAGSDRARFEEEYARLLLRIKRAS